MRRSVAPSILCLVFGGLACSTRATGRVAGAPDVPAGAVGRAPILVAIVGTTPVVSATTAFGWHAREMTLLATARAGEQWRLERQPDREAVRAVAGDGRATPWAPVLIASATNGFVTVNATRFRGQIVVLPLGDTLAVVNRVPLEEYLRSVVAVEMGRRPPQDSAALQAQAIAARSYAVRRMGNRDRPFDVYSSVMDQAYRGIDAENALANAAVERTWGLVLWYGGRVADAVYSSTCGGTTAEAPEVWSTGAVPYLRRVSDRIEGSDRYYCDIAPRFQWTQDMSDAQLNANLERYLARYASVPPGGPGRVRQLVVADRTPSGRVGTLIVESERGTFPLRGNAIRYVLRSSGGEILNSTYFSVHSEHARDGYLDRVTLRGRGYGHGIGMCQWGAIGRSRAGQSFRTILATYYPGTSIAPIQ